MAWSRAEKDREVMVVVQYSAPAVSHRIASHADETVGGYDGQKQRHYTGQTGKAAGCLATPGWSSAASLQKAAAGV